MISSNIDQLLSISNVESLTDIEKPRHIYNKIESAVRNLQSLKVDVGQYEPVFYLFLIITLFNVGTLK